MAIELLAIATLNDLQWQSPISVGTRWETSGMTRKGTTPEINVWTKPSDDEGEWEHQLTTSDYDEALREGAYVVRHADIAPSRPTKL